MDAKSIIELLSGIGACMAAVAAFLTIRQMSKQHKQSYRPDLAFTRTSFYGYSKDPENSRKFPEYWYNKEIEKTEIGETDSRFGLFIYNVGLGVAKEVNVIWNFPLKDFVDDINCIAQRSLLQFYLEHENNVIALKSDSVEKRFDVWKNQKNDSLDYVLPVNVSRDGRFLPIPPAYIFLISIYAHAFIRLKEDRDFCIPSITAIFSYSDVGGGNHQEIFEFHPHIAYFTVGELQGYFDIKKIK